MRLYKLFLSVLVISVSFMAAPAAGAAPLDLSATGQQTDTARLAADTLGNAHVVWLRSDGTNKILQYRRVAADGTPGPTLDLSAAGQDAEDPGIAVDSAGNAHVTWSRFNGAHNSVQYVRIAANGTQGTTLDLNDQSQHANHPDIVVDASDNVHIVWLFRMASLVVQHRRIASDGTLGATVSLSVDGQNAVGPQVAVDSSGNAHVTWTRPNGTHQIAQYARVAANGTPSASIDLSAAGQNALTPAITADSSGDAHVVWHRSNGTHFIVQYVRVAASGSPGAVTNLSAPGGSASGERIVVDSSGTAHVTWFRSAGARSIVQYVRVAADGTTGVTRDLSVVGDGINPTVTVDAANNAHVNWTNIELLQGTSMSVRIAADGTPGSTINLSPPGIDSIDPEVAVDPSGNAHFAFLTENGNYIVQYDKRIGLPTAAPSTLTFDQRAPDAGASVQQVVTVSNSSGAQLPANVGASLTGTGAAAFAISSNTCTAEVAPGATCSIGVTFDPSAAQAYSAKLRVTATGAYSPLEVVLSGAGPVTETPTPDNPTPTSSCPSGTSASVKCTPITAAVRKKYGCAVGQEQGLLMVGTSKNERFVATAKGDIILGRGGKDRVSSGDGNDSVWAGTGPDNVRGGDGDDCLHGGSGSDTLLGRNGNDKLYGEKDPDSLFGNAGNDYLSGTATDTLLRGGTGTNVVLRA